MKTGFEFRSFDLFPKEGDVENIGRVGFIPICASDSQRYRMNCFIVVSEFNLTVDAY